MAKEKEPDSVLESLRQLLLFSSALSFREFFAPKDLLVSQEPTASAIQCLVWDLSGGLGFVWLFCSDPNIL